MKRVGTILLAAVLLTASCAGHGGRNSAGQASSAQPHWRAPQIPEMLDSDAERLDYLMDHWWDEWSPALDSLEAEKVYADWASLTMRVPLGTSSKSIIKGIRKDSLRLLKLTDKYLYNVDSPFRNEDIYGRLAAHCGGDLAAEARLCALNEIGSVATDFVFEDSRGRRHHLHDINAPYTILFFSNPGCHACKDIIEALKADQKISMGVQSGLVAVANIYIDEDLDAWREYLPNYPKEWHTGFDPLFVLRNDNIYHIRAIPSVYLLDYQKKVMLKDAPTDRLIETLDSRI